MSRAGDGGRPTDGSPVDPGATGESRPGVPRVHPSAVVSARAVLAADVRIGPYSVIHDNVALAPGCVVGAHCILGEPTAAGYADPDSYDAPALRIGAGAVIRSGTVIYAGSTIGDAFECGNRVTIREQTQLGRGCRVGTGCDVQGHCEFGDYVRLHSGVFVAHGARLEDFVWLFPNVTVTNDPHPPSDPPMGVTVEEFGVVAAGAILFPGVTVGRDAVVGAGAVVRRNVPAEAVVAGNPAREIGSVRDVRNRHTGEAVYPWRYTFERGMPWAGVGYDAWDAARRAHG